MSLKLRDGLATTSKHPWNYEAGGRRPQVRSTQLGRELGPDTLEDHLRELTKHYFQKLPPYPPTKDFLLVLPTRAKTEAKTWTYRFNFNYVLSVYCIFIFLCLGKGDRTQYQINVCSLSDTRGTAALHLRRIACTRHFNPQIKNLSYLSRSNPQPSSIQSLTVRPGRHKGKRTT